MTFMWREKSFAWRERSTKKTEDELALKAMGPEKLIVIRPDGDNYLVVPVVRSINDKFEHIVTVETSVGVLFVYVLRFYLVGPEYLFPAKDIQILEREFVKKIYIAHLEAVDIERQRVHKHQSNLNIIKMSTGKRNMLRKENDIQKKTKKKKARMVGHDQYDLCYDVAIINNDRLSMEKRKDELGYIPTFGKGYNKKTPYSRFYL